MKKKVTVYITFILSLVVLLSSQSCNSNADNKEAAEKSEKKQTIEIPKLLTRKAAFGTNEEMEMIANIYDKNAKKLSSNNADLKARLSLAEVFITEARVTGVHNYNYNAALKMLNQVIQAKPKEADIMFRAKALKAAIMLSLHQFRKALEIGEEALKINAYSSAAYGILVDANVELGNYQEAVKMSDKMVSLRPDLRSYSRISYLREIHGEVEGAKEAMDMAVKAGYPGAEETTWCRVTLGKLNAQYGDLPNAEMQFNIALQERPNYPYALGGLADVEIRKGNLENAEKLLKEAVAYIPDASFYTSLADLYLEKGEKEKADEMVVEAIELLQHAEDGHSHNHGHSHADSHAHKHQTEELEHTHEVGLEMAKMHLYYTGNYDKAVENGMHEYEIRPDNIDVNKALAGAYYKKGNMEKAKEHLAKARATKTQDPLLDSIEGLIMVKEGNDKEGKALIKKSLEANPFQMTIFSKEGKVIIA